MKDIIKEILHADEVARNKLAKAQDDKNNIPMNATKQKKAINEHYMKEAHDKLETRKIELNQKLEIHQAKLQKEFEATSMEISKQFQANKEKWIQSIYDRCIE
jgi:hypothetical protein